MDLWTADTATGLFTRVTTEAGGESDPTGPPDERSLAYSYIPRAGGTSKQRSAVRRVDLRTGVDQELADAVCTAVDDWTKDDRIICRNGLSMFAVPASGIDKAATMSRDFHGDQSHISPDGNWVAYNSRVSGAFEVYVAHLGRIASGIRVSVDGGVQPLWRRDGAELFYLTPSGTVMSVGVRFDPDFHAETPKPLFKTNLVPSDGWAQDAVTPDGQRFLVREPVRQFFTVLQNWLPPDQRNRLPAIGER